MQKRLVVPWPQGKEEHIFATHTAIVGPKILYETLKESIEDEADELQNEEKMKLMSLKTFVEKKKQDGEEVMESITELREQILK